MELMEHVSTDQTDSVAPAVRTMTKWAEQCRADTGVASWMAGRRRRPQEENTDNILSWQATARMSLMKSKSRKKEFSGYQFICQIVIILFLNGAADTTRA